MIQLPTFFLAVLILFVFDTSLIHSMEPPPSQNKEDVFRYNQCTTEMMQAFYIDIDEKYNGWFVQKAIRNFHISQTTNMNGDVKIYYESLHRYLLPDTILKPDQFCEDFNSEESKRYKQLENNLREKKKEPVVNGSELEYDEFIKKTLEERNSDCKNELIDFSDLEKSEILNEALYERRQASYDDPEEEITIHKPDTYPYYYLKDIAFRIKRKRYQCCILEMQEKFGMDLDKPVRNYVEKAIKDFHISQTTSMHDDVEEYYVSFTEKLHAATIFDPSQFCTEFNSNEIKRKELEENLKKRADETGDSTDITNHSSFKSAGLFKKLTDCIHELYLTRTPEMTKNEILNEALYNRRQCTHDDNVNIVHKHDPTTYEFFYLEDIAERVCIMEGFRSPQKFCFDKYPVTDESTSTR